MARTKMSRHELKSQDEITSTIQKFTEFAYGRKNEVVAAVLVIIVLAGAVVGWRFYSANRIANAQAQLSAVISVYTDTANLKSDKERYEKTLAEAQKTYDQYGSTQVGAIARYYIGMSQAGLGDTAKAIQTLQEVAASGDAGVRSVAQFALGGIYKRTGQLQKAIDVYKQLYDSGGYSKSAVTFELATLHEANNQLDQAKDYYLKLVADFPDSPLRPNGDLALKRLGVTPPPPAPAKNPS